MALRSRIALILLALVLLLLGLPGPLAAQPEEPPTYLDTMDGATPPLLSEGTPDPARFTYAYDQGQFSIQALESTFSGDVYANINVGELADVRITVDAAIADDQPGKYVFAGCRANEEDRGYQFEVQLNTGEVNIWRLPPNDALLLAEGDATQAIIPGFQFNTIEIECRGNTITGSVNGQVIVTATDDAALSGIAYLGAGVYSDAASSLFAAFDNLAVTDFALSQGSVTTPTPPPAGGDGAATLDQLRSQAQAQPPAAGPFTEAIGAGR
jgi:hypothetical protein